MAAFSQSQVSANYAWLEASTGHSATPPTARSNIPASAQQSYTGPTAHYRVGSASTGGINRGRPLPSGGLPPPYQSPGTTWADNPNAGKPSIMPNPYEPQHKYPTRVEPIPKPPRSIPQLRPKTARGPAASWNAAARAGGNATSAAAAAINNSLTGISPAEAVSALGLAGVTAGTVSNAYSQVQNTANQYSGSTSAAVATAYGAAIPFGTGPASGPSNAWVSAPGAAPGAGAVATGAAAAGAGIAALSGWMGEGAAAGAGVAKVSGPYMGSLEYEYRGFSTSILVRTVRSDFTLESRRGEPNTSSDYEIWAVWPGGEEKLGQSKHSYLAVTPLSFDGGPLPTGDEPPSETTPALDRPVSESLADPPSTRDTSPPRRPAPARTRTPRRAPTAPSAPPLEFPAPQPIPPGALPETSPLVAPTTAPETPTAPEAPPIATPATVPKPTPAPAPSITPKPKPRDTPEKPGTTVVDTPTGPAEIATPPGGLSEAPTGATVQTDKTPLELEAPNENWWITPTLIGGALITGTAVADRLKDPTKPGQFVTTAKPPPKARIDNPVDSKCKCNGPLLSAMGANNAATQAQLARIEANQNNPVSGFGALQVGQAGILGLLQSVNTFMRKAWEMTRMQKVLDVLTFIGVMHNVSMLSRGVGSTFLEVVGQGIQALGIRDEEGEVLDIHSMVTGGIETMLRSLLGDAVYDGTAEAWNKANRIISSASMIIWTVRSLFDTSLDLMEWVGENTGKIGNALKRWGVVGERDYPWMSERAQAQSRIRSKFNKITGVLENTEDRVSTFGIATGGVIEVQEETAELGENFGRFKDSVINGIPDPWDDNVPIKEPAAAAKAAADALPDIPVVDSQKG